MIGNVFSSLGKEPTMKELIDAIILLERKLNHALSHIKNDQIVANLSADKITTGTLDADKVNVVNLDATTIVTTTVVTETLYADKAVIAELTVDRLDTSSKVQNYLSSDTSDVNYLRMQDQYIEFVTASTTGLSTVQLTDRNAANIYWTDATKTAITTTTTAYPVTIYVYTEQVKLRVSFENISGVYTPQMTWGVGNGDGDNEKGYLIKSTSGFDLKYITNDVEQILRNGPNGIQVTGVGGQTKSLRNISISSSTPTDPETNDLWINTSA